ncbi:MAG TPA: ROK family protein [Jatrophihabitantaceae bacterium]|jgi:polyphosphate glucokinase
MAQVGRAFGIDIGGSGIKGAIVDTATGELVTERTRILTPQPSTPDAVAEVVAKLVSDAGWNGPVGATFPAVIQHGVARSAANVDPSWIGTDVDACFTRVTPSATDVHVLNDADAAGIAEARFGAARGVSGVVILLTFGTGIGSALLLDGTLVPNTELGHLELDGYDAEKRAAASVREEGDMSYKDWAKRVDRYMSHVEHLFTPDLFVVGGGVSKSAAKWVPRLTVHTPVKPAELRNDAGIVGAAMAAAEMYATRPDPTR